MNRDGSKFWERKDAAPEKLHILGYGCCTIGKVSILRSGSLGNCNSEQNMSGMLKNPGTNRK